MKSLYINCKFNNFQLFALAAIMINLLISHLAGYTSQYSDSIYAIGSVIILGFIVLYSSGFTFPAKLMSSIFFNVFFFAFTEYYGLRSMVFIYYFPFLISHMYMYKESATKFEARFFICSSIFFMTLMLITCSINGHSFLTSEQQAIMFKKNFIVAFLLSGYYFNAIFSTLLFQTKVANEASASKARFLSIMSHELRTPLNGIISSINLMDLIEDESEKQKYKNILNSSSEHLLHLVNNVLDYSKASSGKMELNPVNCSIEMLLANLQAVFESRFAEKNLHLQLLVDKEVKTNVIVDDVRFVQVLTNLLSNALKFTDKGKVVMAAKFISRHSNNLEIEISVTDTGKGLTKNQQGKIFELFNNVDNKSANVESSGLGLPICKMIIEMMGGTLDLESRAGKGSKFYFNLNVPMAPAIETKVKALPEVLPFLDGVKVLIAEDNPINMIAARGFLERWNVQVIEASNGLIAQKLLINNPDIELLLLDLQMPTMNGYELMKWLKENKFTLPVLAFTAQLMEKKEKAELYELGFTEMIPKPFAPKELMHKMQSALASRQMKSA